MAVFEASGIKVPVNKEWLTILNTSSERQSKTVSKNRLDMGSREHIEGFNSETTFFITSVSTTVIEHKVYLKCLVLSKTLFDLV